LIVDDDDISEDGSSPVSVVIEEDNSVIWEEPEIKVVEPTEKELISASLMKFE
jgi:hypothetical protein